MLHLFQRFAVRHGLFPKRVSSLPHPIFFQMKALEDGLHATLAILRRHINPLESPLYRLTPDLFPEVASHLTSETDLVNATHVSYYLRNNLLFRPSLWSHLNFKHEMSSRAFFERSGQAPLHLDLPVDTSRTVGFLTELRQQSKRISTLKLPHWPIQKKFLSVPLPSLRRLEISFGYYHVDNQNQDWDAWEQVWGPTENATSWSFPSLTSLVIYNLLPIAFYTPRLTYFKFWDVESPTDPGELLNFLDNCPLLEHIDLFYPHGQRREQDLVVSLPNLRTYTEATLLQECPLIVLNNLSLPPSCSITLRFQSVVTAMGVDGMFPRFKNPDYLAQIKRVKLTTTLDTDGNEVAGTLELINTKGTRVRSERMDLEKKGDWPRVQGDKNHPHIATHLNFLKNLDGRSVEILCIDGCVWYDTTTAGFLNEALDFGGVGTLILSHRAAESCLWTLGRESNASGCGRRFSSVHTLIIHSGIDNFWLGVQILEPLLGIARKSKVAGSPLRSVSLFLSVDWAWDGILEGSRGCVEEFRECIEELRGCVEKLEIFTGDDVLDWDVDKYFLDGFDHLQKNRDV